MKEIFNSIAPLASEANDFPILPIALSIVLLSSIVVGIVYIFKGKIWALVSGLLLGALNLIIFLALVNTIGYNPDGIETAKNIILIPGNLFIALIVIVIPAYLLFVVAEFIFSEQLGEIKTKTYFTSFGSLLGLSLFGILLAILMIPLIMLIPDGLFDNSISGDLEGEEGGGLLGWFIDWKVILGVILTSLVVSSIARLAMKEPAIIKTRNVLQTIVKYISKYISWIIVIVPFVVLTRFGAIGLNHIGTASNILSLMAIYLGLYWLGALTIFGTLFAFNLLLSTSDTTMKERSVILMNQLLAVFANQSASASLPVTQQTARDLGVCDEISKLTPTKGIIMGMVMCNGFTPMLIILLTLANAGMLTIGNVLITASLIMVLAISTSGTGSADYTIILATLGVLNISTGFYATVVMPIQEMNERTITKPNNSLGHLVATQLTERVHSSTKACDCKEKEEI